VAALLELGELPVEQYLDPLAGAGDDRRRSDGRRERAHRGRAGNAVAREAGHFWNAVTANVVSGPALPSMSAAGRKLRSASRRWSFLISGDGGLSFGCGCGGNLLFGRAMSVLVSGRVRSNCGKADGAGVCPSTSTSTTVRLAPRRRCRRAV